MAAVAPVHTDVSKQTRGNVEKNTHTHKNMYRILRFGADDTEDDDDSSRLERMEQDEEKLCTRNYNGIAAGKAIKYLTSIFSNYNTRTVLKLMTMAVANEPRPSLLLSTSCQPADKGRHMPEHRSFISRTRLQFGAVFDRCCRSVLHFLHFNHGGIGM